MQIVDLTLPINNRMTGIPGLAEYDNNPTRTVMLSALSEEHRDMMQGRGIELADDLEITYHSMSRLEILTHIGTHIDAPIHFVEGGPTIDNVGLDKVVKKGRIVPLTDTPPKSPVTADAILATGVEIGPDAIPVLHTGWTDKAWGTDRFWNDMIWLDTSVGDLMVERGVSAVAIDCFPESPFWLGIHPDDPDLPHGPNHVRMLGQGTIIIQLLTNIDEIGDREFTLCAAPLKLEDLDGSPARVFAMVQ